MNARLQPGRLITEWSTDDPAITKLLQQINALPENTPERHEAEAWLHMFQARLAWRRADRLHQLTRDREANERRRRERAAAKADG